MLNYDSVGELKTYLAAHDIGMQKKFGQNFMVDATWRRKIIALLPDVDGESWEIGPGLGAMTRLLCDQGGHIVVFEIDRGFIACLKDLFSPEIDCGKMEIVEGDARQNLFARDIRPRRILGNLPYNVGSGIIARLITGGFADTPMVFTLQREVVQRMTARPGDPDYGSFSILCQYFTTAENHGTISSGAFYPAPEVSSAVVRLLPRKEIDSQTQAEGALLDELLRCIFLSRRKTLSNNLKNWKGVGGIDKDRVCEGFEACGISLSLRAETLSPEQVRSVIAQINP